MKKCIIMSGIQGAGKTTWRNNYIDQVWNPLYRKCFPSEVIICSADDYFTTPEGVYKFEPASLPIAHRWCFGKANSALTMGFPLVIIDNTNIRVAEIAPYYVLADFHGYDVEVVRIQCDPEVAAARCVHEVPREKILSNAVSFDPLPPWWNVRIVHQPVSWD